MIKGTLFLLPSPLGPEISYLPSPEIKSVINNLELFIVENEKHARRYLRLMGCNKHFDSANMFKMDKNNPQNTDPTVFAQIQNGKNAGLLSDAGLPCVADPGCYWVLEAHRLNIKVKPISGPSSIVLALISSGLNGQNFSFKGYLPVKQAERQKMLRRIEETSISTGETQIFIETPYRNQSLFEDILKTCRKTTLLCLAQNITLQNEIIETATIAQWCNKKTILHRHPVVFLLNGARH